MTSQILSLFQVFGPRAARTSAAPNSWATVSLWRRFFQMQEEEQEEMVNVVARALDEIPERQVRPAHCQDMVAARRDFISQHYQRMVVPRPPSLNPFSVAAAAAATGQEHETQARVAQEQQLGRPNLEVPGPSSSDGLPASAYLAQ